MSANNQQDPFIAVISDDLDQLDLLSGHLRKINLEPRAFKSAEAAIEALFACAKRGDESSLPALIITDLAMQGIDGCRFCRLLRSPEYAIFNRIPILVISAAPSITETAHIANNLMVEAFVAAPVDEKLFVEQVRAILKGERLSLPLRVLIVDSDASHCELLQKYLIKNDCLADVASAIGEASEAFGKTAYDAALIDHCLADGPGDALMEKLHSLRSECVYIMMAGNPGPDQALSWMKRGASACLRKPVDPSALIELCRQVHREHDLLHSQELFKAHSDQLRASEERLHYLADNLPNAMLYQLTAEPDGGRRFIYVSRSVERLNEVTVENVLANAGVIYNQVLPQYRALVKEREEEALKNLATLHVEVQSRLPSGRLRWFQYASTPCYQSENFLVWNGVEVDITEQKTAEESLRENEAIQRLIMDNLPAQVAFYDAKDLRCQFVNKVHTNMFTLTFENSVGRHVREIIGEELYARSLPYFDRARSGELVVCDEKAMAQGEQYWFNIRFVPHFDNQGIVRNILVMVVDITKRKCAEESLQRAEERLRNLADNLPNAMVCQIVAEPNGGRRYIYVSRAVEQLNEVAAEDIMADASIIYNQILPEYHTLVKEKEEEALRNLTTFQVELQCRLPSGKLRWFKYMATPRYQDDGMLVWNAVEIDITQRKESEEQKEKLEAQNRQLQKSESLGLMAGAIAHHFNNQLQAILLNLELALDNHPEDAELSEQLGEAVRSAHKAAEVSKLMLTYLGKNPFIQEPLDLSAFCLKNLPVFKVIISQQFVLDHDLPLPGPTINADANQLQQILANLITNSREAMVSDRGFIRLAVKTVDAAAIPLKHRFPIDFKFDVNSYACLEVTDNGCGIPAKDIEKLFDPFFTTKFTGRGLGLPIVLGIVRAHGGCITVKSKLGKGSLFRIYFPMSAEAIPQRIKKPVESKPLVYALTILLVEDDHILRKTTKTMLMRDGFQVLEASNGVEALEIFKNHQDQIQLVICDLIMPRMDGWETLTNLRQFAPDLPIILTSGYNEARVMEGHHTELPEAFLSKPYDYKVLRDAIARILSEKR